MIGTSAANAAVENNATAPATTTDLTLRIGFVLLSGAARRKFSRTSETHARTMAAKT
jgi:hypothetical protein